ncbi:MAG TPA: acyl-CoA dehydrogenase family protein [Acidimicrobiia bacterium]|nr:acyl-CoA dehydrogenase family protein [Acidimicrobiia bacterium]
MDAGERALLAATVGDAIAAIAAEGGTADGALTELGWLEMLDAEPRDAVGIVFSALGAQHVTATVLDDVVAGALGIEPRAAVALLLSPYTTWAPPGRVDGGLLHASGVTTARVATADELVVAAEADGRLALATVPASAVTITPVAGIDPAAGLHAVEIGGAVASTVPLDLDAWDAAVAAGRRALAHQVAGACRTMLEQARAHALDRSQFGRPVARFQAVRHRLAEALVAVEALDAAVAAAWDEPGPVTAALAKAVAGRTARTVAAHCQQVLAGIGFTTEHPFHRYLKRTIALDGLLGSTDAIVADLGRLLIATRTVPTLVEL